jgi:predicted phosphoribosyltransferase
LTDRAVLIVDDDLAAGFTLLVTVDAVNNAGAASITMAVATGHMESIDRIVKHVDAVYCPQIIGGMRFAVADAYKQWSDVTDEELLELLRDGQDNTNL